AMAGGANGYRAALVNRQLTPALISSLPGTAGLPPCISFSTSYPELPETPDAARRISLPRRINVLRLNTLCLCLALAAGVASAQERRSMSPRGTAATQVGGKWTPETQGED